MKLEMAAKGMIKSWWALRACCSCWKLGEKEAVFAAIWGCLSLNYSSPWYIPLLHRQQYKQKAAWLFSIPTRGKQQREGCIRPIQVTTIFHPMCFLPLSQEADMYPNEDHFIHTSYTSAEHYLRKISTTDSPKCRSTFIPLLDTN